MIKERSKSLMEQNNKEKNYFLLSCQQRERDEAELYKRISDRIKDPEAKKILKSISQDENSHAEKFASYSNQILKPNMSRIRFYNFIAIMLGYTFMLKMFERGEEKAINSYKAHIAEIPMLETILRDEEAHEAKLIDLLDEERLQYVGDMVLGMNDALVELTGSLAGYTLAMQNTSVIAMAGLITGISATLSMSASGYLSSRASGNKNAVKSSAYTGIAYLITVVLLIIPYLLFSKDNYIPALIVTMLIAISIIAGFNFYISVAKDEPFKRNFFEMAGISMGVAVISFIVGIIVKQVLGIDL
jgi:VIT1/CCC1 family predicted Fe2+/Mn2+ transporter